MGNPKSPASRVRSGATHRTTLTVPWSVTVTGIEFIGDYPMEADGSNDSDTPDAFRYLEIKENFAGWGRGKELTGWDWEGRDNPKRPACYHREKPVSMRVRLHSAIPAPSFRNFVLEVAPALNGDKTLLTAGSVLVPWPSGSQEQIVTVTTGGALPNEVARYDLHLSWSIKALVVFAAGATPSVGVAGIISQTNHRIYCIFEDPLNPELSNATGKKLQPVTGLTAQRLDKLMLAHGGAHLRFPTQTDDDVNRLIWQVTVYVNDHSPPYFDNNRAAHVQYGIDGPSVEFIDQWVMWLTSRPGPDHPADMPHWNFGACITYVHLMKAMLAVAGINTRRAWLIPKSPVWPDRTKSEWDDSQLFTLDGVSGSRISGGAQDWTFIADNGVEFHSFVRLIDRPDHGRAAGEAFEACLFYDGKLVPAAIPTSRFPPKAMHERGFANPKDLLRWWHNVHHQGFQRFMAWVSEATRDHPLAFFDKDSNIYKSPYEIPKELRLPLD
jgi:hypothetical protein